MNATNRNRGMHACRPLEAGDFVHADASADRTRARVIPRAGILLVGMLIAALAFAGCGKHSIDQTTTATGTGTAVVEPEPGQVVAASMPGADSARAESPVVSESGAPSLPPEVEAATEDSVVTPGAVVEITALASPDVVELKLSDGIGKEQAFVYDTTMKVWRVFYRVPIRLTNDHYGLAVTATNQDRHWRRVWVFLNIQN